MFKRLQLHSLTLAAVVAILAFFPPLASAGQITVNDIMFVVDTPTNVIVSLNHASQAPFPHTSVLPAIVSNSGFWSITGLTIVEANNNIHIIGNIQHLMSPPGHPNGGLGPLFHFDLTVTTVPRRLVDVDRCCDPMHDVHFDLYSARLEGTLLPPPNANNFASFNLRIEGAHTIPEPATMILLGTGLTGVAVKMRKRIKTRKKAQGSQ